MRYISYPEIEHEVNVSGNSQSRQAKPKRRRRTAHLTSPIRDKEHLVRLGYYTKARQGFPNDAALAAAFPVHRSRIASWKQGEPPDEENARLLRDLAVVVDELEDVFDREVIPDWLFADRIGGPSPMELLRRGNLAEVLLLINAASTGAYS